MSLIVEPFIGGQAKYVKSGDLIPLNNSKKNLEIRNKESYVHQRLSESNLKVTILSNKEKASDSYRGLTGYGLRNKNFALFVGGCDLLLNNLGYT